MPTRDVMLDSLRDRAVTSSLAGCRAEFERVAAAATQDGLARRALYGGAVCAALGNDLERAGRPPGVRGA